MRYGYPLRFASALVTIAIVLAQAGTADAQVKRQFPVKPGRAAVAAPTRPVRKVVRAVPTHAVVTAYAVPPRNVGGERPHLRQALDQLDLASHTMMNAAGETSAGVALSELRSAFAELNASAASDVYHGHRSKAIDCTREAIRLLKARQSGGQIVNLTNEAIGDVQFCLQAPVK